MVPCSDYFVAPAEIDYIARLFKFIETLSKKLRIEYINTEGFSSKFRRNSNVYKKILNSPTFSLINQLNLEDKKQNRCKTILLLS